MERSRVSERTCKRNYTHECESLPIEKFAVLNHAPQSLRPCAAIENQVTKVPKDIRAVEWRRPER